ncbi:MAG: histidine phosphatase family protein, partial [Chloroflexota bacterium]|nr:histidine phosphatase family protein [Chloroflexota bacterium]
LERPEQTPDGWEPVAEATDRVTECIRELEASHAGSAVAVCGHGLAWTLYLEAVDPSPLGPYETWSSIGFGTVAVLQNGELESGFVQPTDVV